MLDKVTKVIIYFLMRSLKIFEYYLTRKLLRTKAVFPQTSIQPN